MEMTKLGRFLQALRREKGLTQAQLSETLHVSGKTISRWETAFPAVKDTDANYHAYTGLTKRIKGARHSHLLLTIMPGEQSSLRASVFQFN